MSYTKIPTGVMEFFLPMDSLTWFDIVDGVGDKKTIHITLEEKNNPPVPPEYKNHKIKSKGFRDITISDYPIRGRTALLTFRRRSWEVENSNVRLKREIKLVAPGTLLEKEFADFLKDRG